VALLQCRATQIGSRRWESLSPGGSDLVQLLAEHGDSRVVKYALGSSQ